MNSYLKTYIIIVVSFYQQTNNFCFRFSIHINILFVSIKDAIQFFKNRI